MKRPNPKDINPYDSKAIKRSKLRISYIGIEDIIRTAIKNSRKKKARNPYKS